MSTEIELFVMEGCNICPQMERLFEQLQHEGVINQLIVRDVQQFPELAQQYGIRSVPYYRINGVSFTGLKSRGELERIFGSSQRGKLINQIEELLKQGELQQCETLVLNNPLAIEAIMSMLMDGDTELTVRIGLTAIVETLAENGVLKDYQSALLKMSRLDDERLVIDGLYFLSLIPSSLSQQRLQEAIKNGESEQIRAQAKELLAEMEYF